MILLILVAFEMKFISLKNITTRQNKHAFLFYRLTFWWKALSRQPKLIGAIGAKADSLRLAMPQIYKALKMMGSWTTFSCVLFSVFSVHSIWIAEHIFPDSWCTIQRSWLEQKHESQQHQHYTRTWKEVIASPLRAPKHCSSTAERCHKGCFAEEKLALAAILLATWQW